jgi:hypothetical protein
MSDLKRVLLPFLCMLILTVSCSRRQSTVLIDSWSDSEIVSPGYERLLVIGVSPNPERRKIFEEDMVKDLKKRGVEAISWLETVSPDEEVTPETFDKYFRVEDLDAVLLTRVLNVEELPKTIPSNKNKTPPSELYDNFYNYYEHVRVKAQNPTDFESGTAVFLETHLYDTGDASLVWAGQSKSLVMNKPRIVIRDIAKVVVQTFAEEGIIN